MSNCMGLKVQFDTMVNYIDYNIEKALMDFNWAKEENLQDEEGFNGRYDRQHDDINVEKI